MATRTPFQNITPNIVAWNLGVKITPQIALTYATATALMIVSAVLWFLRNELFVAALIAGTVILAQAIARDSLENNFIGRMLVLLGLGIFAQIPFTSTLSMLINPIFTFGVGLAIVYGLTHKFWVVKITTVLMAFSASIVCTPVIYGVWLIAIYRLLYKVRTTWQRRTAIIALTLLLAPISADKFATVGLLVAALNVFLEKTKLNQRGTFTQYVIQIVVVFFSFVFIKNIIT